MNNLDSHLAPTLQLPSPRFPPRESLNVPSLIKWTGSKRSQARAIAALIPNHRRYFEPFLGGGALMYMVAKPGSLGSDIYEPLVALWTLVKNDPGSVISNYSKQWNLLQRDFPKYFYLVRDRFNNSPDPLDLCFLLRTCVNGIVRFNDQGKFNNSFHLSRPGMHPSTFAQVVFSWAHKLAGVTLRCCDYSKTVAEATKHDFIYLDPPYAANKQRYAQDLDLDAFLQVLASLTARGVRWALSFDGKRSGKEISTPLPKDLYKRKLYLRSGNSPVGKVLNGPIEPVDEALYLNY